MLDVLSEPKAQAANIAAFSRALVKLTSTGAFVAMGLSLLFSEPTTFVRDNAIATLDRGRLLAAILCGALLPTTIAGGLMLWKRALHSAICRVASLTRPLAVLGFLPVLLLPELWYSKPLPFLAVLVGLCLLLEHSLNDAFGAGLAKLLPIQLAANRVPFWLKRYAPIGLVLTASLAYAIFTFYYSVQQHQRFHTSAYDLGIYDNLIFNTMRGDFFLSPVLMGPSGGSYLQNHAEFAQVLFVPIYAIYPSAVTLLAIQAVMLGFAAVPLFLFVRRQLTEWTAVVIAFCFLLFAPLHGASFYDFHWLPLALFFHFWLYYAIATRKNWLLFCCWFVLVLIREDISVGLTFLGLFLTVSGVRPRLGAVFMVVNALMFVTIKFGIMNSVGEFIFAKLIYGDLVAPGEKGFSSVIKTMLTNPMYLAKTLLVEDKLILVLHLFGPLALLPLRRLHLALLVAGGCFFTLLTTSYPPTVSIRFQYPTHWIPYLFAATTLMLGWLSRGRLGVSKRRSALAAVVFGVLVHSYCFGAILQHKTFVGGFYPLKYGLTKAEKTQYKKFRQLIQQIPAGASVAATERLVPHVSTRRSAYTLRFHHGDADYLLLKTPLSKNEKNVARRAVRSHDYGLVESSGSFYLLRRGHESADTPAALKRLGLPSKAKP